jgi:hypothetical protein
MQSITTYPTMAYANGVFAYVREVGSRTEQYWCPIKHARRVLGVHAARPRPRSRRGR